MPAPNPPTDLLERAKIAVFAVLDANAQIAGVTGRANGNLVAWSVEMNVALPVVAYRATVATRGGASTGDTREVMFLFSAAAPTESEANALLEIIEGGIQAPAIVWVTALAALARPLDAIFINPVRREIGWDSDVDGYRNDLEYTLVVTK